jgi:hypothetical protein
MSTYTKEATQEIVKSIKSKVSSINDSIQKGVMDESVQKLMSVSILEINQVLNLLKSQILMKLIHLEELNYI